MAKRERALGGKVAVRAPESADLAGTDQTAARILLMGSRKETLTGIFSYTAIGVSLALMSGLALGHVTKQSMHPRLSAQLPLDPVERYALGQNAYKTSNVAIKSTQARPSAFTDGSYEIGRYEKGSRILIPAEPARKIERLRLERLQDWNDRNFGSDPGVDDTYAGYTEDEDYAPIDVGAVMDAPETAAMRASGT
ncbi:hypothetical protein [Sphingorhabdus sp. M41]|uniref:hypothetical protein n=1 Tax=Sphingorhabdus sp. M41 TaxID=1806885 RepID=UPI00078CA4D5|nr:hypothetical protein [Sphingorhabdus sp. M41]AMO72861.1 hypothetical protein AZE99_14270 [Sphingorhabdus sp. M41]